MQKLLIDLLINVAATGLASLIARSWRGGRRLLLGKELSAALDVERTALVPVIEEALGETTAYPDWEQVCEPAKVCDFLSSPEVEGIARQIYSTRLLKQPSGKLRITRRVRRELADLEENSRLDSIKQEFVSLLSAYVGVTVDKLGKRPERLFNALLATCHELLALRIDTGVLSAHEAMSAYRHHVLLDEIEGLRRALDFVVRFKGLNLSQILDFEVLYRAQVAERNRLLVPPHYDSATRVPLEQLYVLPDFFSVTESHDEDGNRLGMRQILEGVHRLVVLGNPGCGKTTFTSKIAYQLAEHYKERFVNRRTLTPIVVTIRDYGAAKRERGIGLLQLISEDARTKYVVDPPPMAFEYLLLNGRCAVIFDGLDELLDTAYRMDVVQDIEAFCARFPSVSVIVTSRVIGYSQAPLDIERFTAYRMAPFSKDQVEEYTKNWFRVVEGSPEQAKEQANLFLSESKVAGELRRNPLMLALMCNLYRGDGYIPSNRPDIYEKCSEMLFWKHDKRKGMRSRLPFEAHMRPAVMEVAHWIYSSDQQAGVTESKLLQRTAAYLHEHCFEDEVEAQHQARSFIEFCTGRAWVFTDTGLTPEGERIYQFTHRTFLEYYTAAYLVRHYHTYNALFDVLSQHVWKQEWDVVAQLSCQMLNRQVEGASDGLLELFLKGTDTLPKEAGYGISFAVRLLEFMVPSPREGRSVCRTAMEWIMDRMVLISQREQEQSRLPNEVLAGLAACARENHRLISEELLKSLLCAFESSSYMKRLAAFELAIEFRSLLESGLLNMSPEDAESWDSVVVRFLAEVDPELRRLATQDSHISHRLWWLDLGTLGDIVQHHGMASILCPLYSFWFPGSPEQAGSYLTFWLLRLLKTYSSKKNLEDLRDLGGAALKTPLPWFSKPKEITYYTKRIPSDWWVHLNRHYAALELSEEKPPPLEFESVDSDMRVGAFVLLAILAEAWMSGTANLPRRALMRLPKSSDIVTDGIIAAIVARLQDDLEPLSRVDFSREGFKPSQEAFIRDWLHHKHSFISRHSRSD